ncbi:MAG: septum site-determining protein MinC [Lachnospiraceae bacterium]|nr:septum site-determining protein MinC [Lachnospiraceae bacterium]
MKNTVIIKGNKYGLSIVLDDKVEFPQLIEDLAKRLENAEDFFDSKKQLAVTFEGRTLTNEEMDQILTVIEENSKLNIQYVMDENSELEATFFDIIHSEENRNKDGDAHNQADYIDSQNEESILTEVIPLFSAENEDLSGENPKAQAADGTGMFYKGTLRSGQALEAKDSLVIVGDVNPGATVIAGGNIVIIGTLKGSVTAGAYGNKDAFVLALSMNPIQIKIADVIAIYSDKKQNAQPLKDAMLAFIEHGQIVMKPVSKNALQNIR